jgi:hypothetical protein
MKTSQLKQIIREEISKILIENNTLDEGWKENVLVGLASLAGSLGGIKAQDMPQTVSSKNKTEISAENPYSVLIGYLIELSNSRTGNPDPDEIEAIRDARIYLENLRDGKTPGSLSEKAKFVLSYAVKETKGLDGPELVRLSDLGSGVKSTNY